MFIDDGKPAAAKKAAAPAAKKAPAASYQSEGGFDFKLATLPLSLAAVVGGGIALAKVDPGFSRVLAEGSLKVGAGAGGGCVGGWWVVEWVWVWVCERGMGASVWVGRGVWASRREMDASPCASSCPGHWLGEMSFCACLWVGECRQKNPTPRPPGSRPPGSTQQPVSLNLAPLLPPPQDSNLYAGYEPVLKDTPFFGGSGSIPSKVGLPFCVY